MYLIPKNVKVKKEIFRGFGILEILVMPNRRISSLYLRGAYWALLGFLYDETQPRNGYIYIIFLLSLKFFFYKSFIHYLDFPFLN